MKRLGARSILKITITTILALAALTLLAGYAEVDHILRPPRNIPQGKTLRKYNIPYQDVELVTEDGIHLAAWYTPPRKGAVILVAHGFGDQRPEWVYEMLARKGYGVLAWDARAHGASGGDISTVGYLEVLDVKAALDFALSQPGVDHVGAWGGSMGGATLIRAAAQYPEIEALFVDSPFASLDDELNYLIPYPIINPLAKVVAQMETGVDVSDVSPLEVIGQISPRPVYLVQGTGDRTAPPDSAERLYHMAKGPRFLWTKENVPHLGMYLDNPRRYKKNLIEFFDTWLLGEIQ